MIPARPPEMWSRLAMRRAAWKGGQKVAEMVVTRPIREVARARAVSVVTGSRNQAGPPPTPPMAADWPSARKKASSLPRSAICASSSQYVMSPRRPTEESAARQAEVWCPAAKAKRLMCTD